jgi:hypothetical protein
MSIFQTLQYCADSWRDVIGTAGITLLLASFDTQETFRDSDSERQKFAKYYLEDFRFLYEDSDHEDKEVRKLGCYPAHMV